jgi:hypothetical protein
MVLFVMRVEGLAPGLYARVRDEGSASALRRECSGWEWRRIEDGVALVLLATATCADAARLAKALSGGQDIAGDASFCMAMICDMKRPDAEVADAWLYRRMQCGCGVLGQLLYLEAGAASMRGTGIMVFDDVGVLAMMGLGSGSRFQDFYHFAVGAPLADDRLA